MGKDYSRSNRLPKVDRKDPNAKDLALELDYSRGHTTRHNDVSWYSKDPALIRDAASIPFAEPLGPEVKYGPRSRSVPGVAVLHYIPTVGAISKNSIGQSPINLAAVRYYSEIRKANSGARNYDPNDLIQILLGVAGIYEALSFGKRIYSLLRDYQQTNRYYSRRLIESMHLNFDDFLANIANLRYFINVCITRCEVFAIPAGMSFLLRRIWMNESIFLDAPMRKAQTYLFVPLGVQEYDWENGEVKISPWMSSEGDTAWATEESGNMGQSSNRITFDYYKNTLERMLGNMTVNTDVGIITGDLLKAYGESGVFRMAPIDIDYHIEPLFSQEVLTQIHNSNFIIDTEAIEGGIFDDNAISTFTIKQNGALLDYDGPNSNPQVKGSRLMSKDASPKYQSTEIGNTREDLLLLDMPIDPVNPDQVMVATRLTAVRELTSIVATAAEAVYDITNFGSEVLLFATLFTLDRWMIYSTNLTNGTYTIDELLNYTTPFSYLPRAFVYAKQTDTPIAGESCYLFDDIELGTIDNYTIIADTTLFKMHQTAVLSEFNVSSMPASNGRK